MSRSPVRETKRKSKWSEQEDNTLTEWAQHYKEKQWKLIAKHLPGRTSIQCLHRWTKILKPGLVKGPWTPQEDDKLFLWVEEHGPNKWTQCARNVRGRSGKQCRERWFNNLCPEVKKGIWSKKEDELIFELFSNHGSSWSKIAKYVPGRTENSIKNRFYSTMRRIAVEKRKARKTGLPFEEISSRNQGAGRLYDILKDKIFAADELASNLKQDDPNPFESDGINVEAGVALSFNIKGEEFVLTKSSMTGGAISTPQKIRNPNQNGEELNVPSTIDQSILQEFFPEDLGLYSECQETYLLDTIQQKVLGFCHDSVKELTQRFKLTAIKKGISPEEEHQQVIKAKEQAKQHSPIALQLRRPTTRRQAKEVEKATIMKESMKGAGEQAKKIVEKLDEMEALMQRAEQYQYDSIFQALDLMDHGGQMSHHHHHQDDREEIYLGEGQECFDDEKFDNLYSSLDQLETILGRTKGEFQELLGMVEGKRSKDISGSDVKVAMAVALSQNDSANSSNSKISGYQKFTADNYDFSEFDIDSFKINKKLRL